MAGAENGFVHPHRSVQRSASGFRVRPETGAVRAARNGRHGHRAQEPSVQQVLSRAERRGGASSRRLTGSRRPRASVVQMNIETESVGDRE